MSDLGNRARSVPRSGSPRGSPAREAGGSGGARRNQPGEAGGSGGGGGRHRSRSRGGEGHHGPVTRSGDRDHAGDRAGRASQRSRSGETVNGPARAGAGLSGQGGRPSGSVGRPSGSEGGPSRSGGGTPGPDDPIWLDELVEFLYRKDYEGYAPPPHNLQNRAMIRPLTWLIRAEIPNPPASHVDSQPAYYSSHVFTLTPAYEVAGVEVQQLYSNANRQTVAGEIPQRAKTWLVRRRGLVADEEYSNHRTPSLTIAREAGRVELCELHVYADPELETSEEWREFLGGDRSVPVSEYEKRPPGHNGPTRDLKLFHLPHQSTPYVPLQPWEPARFR